MILWHPLTHRTCASLEAVWGTSVLTRFLRQNSRNISLVIFEVFCFSYTWNKWSLKNSFQEKIFLFETFRKRDLSRQRKVTELINLWSIFFAKVAAKLHSKHFLVTNTFSKISTSENVDTLFYLLHICEGGT